jgi:hypothetical protein
MVQWLQAHLLACPVKKYLQLDCPGCGFQRSFTELLQGHLAESFRHHPVTIPLLLFFLYAALHLWFKFRNGHRVLLYGYIFVAAILVTNYIYKILQPATT